MDPRKDSGYKVKREPEELDLQPVTKKVKKENANLDTPRRPVKVEHAKQEPKLEELNSSKKEEDTKCNFKKESTNLDSHIKREHIKEEHIKKECKQELKLQKPNDLNKQEDTNFIKYSKCERIQDTLARNWVEALPLLLRALPLELTGLLNCRWDSLTEKETFLEEIWWGLQKYKPSEKDLNMHWEKLSDDLKVLNRKQAEVRTKFYKKIRRAVDRQFKKGQNEDVLYSFAIYFREFRERVKVWYPDMTRQEVYDTCLLHYFAMTNGERKKYESRLIYENDKINSHHVDLFRKHVDYSRHPEVIHLSREEIEAYIKHIPRIIEVERLKEDVKQGETEKPKFIVLDIKEKYANDTLANQINSRWKDLTLENNFQYEVTRAFGGMMLVEDINVVWKNLSEDMWFQNLSQTAYKRDLFKKTKLKMEEELNEDMLYSFSSYFCEFENIIRAEFPDMTEAEVYVTCLLRYIAAPKKTREIYEILSAREECKKFCESRFGRMPPDSLVGRI